MTPPIRFRGFRKVWMITVMEGEGTTEHPFREVHYVYDEDGHEVGAVDTIGTSDVTRNLQNAINTP